MINPIDASNPVVIPATNSVSLDKLAIHRAIIDGEQFPKLNAYVDLIKYGISENGVVLDTKTSRVNFIDIFKLAEEDEDILNWINLTLDIIRTKIVSGEIEEHVE